MKSSTSPVAQKYYVDYRWSSDTPPERTGRWATLATSPIQAIDWFHQSMQRDVERNGMRQIVRPRLRFDQYVVVRFERDGFAPYDLPICGNPDLRPKPKASPPATSEMDFCAGSLVGRLAD